VPLNRIVPTRDGDNVSIALIGPLNNLEDRSVFSALPDYSVSG
jgi:hypothetical protein